MDRREFVVGVALQAALAAGPALADVPIPYDWSASPPRGSRDAFVEWMVKNRGEDPRFLGAALRPVPRAHRATMTCGTRPICALIS